ncbi:hypothetical protein BJ684DRAFT_11284 [Piptocephalis cylindrospora]|uniref:Uncharacterized protein n=1 Tax=Piptocephalis cylindrospora TaxID=1907219 RepID=A0A4P9Y1E4_9FUNG|nr:hypothetical protein BJ684DRAFT_11284 [Piptocephalis cylindrospora]|eukprot:RKP12583.1 hypothetical protein BJ684DRAFT_11284 [Piptocephalis cylindrospora]
MSSTSPFWRNLRKLLVVNPAWEDSMPVKGYRLPSPGSRPEYVRPIDDASAVRNNPYYKRDARRNYPLASQYTQADVAAYIAGPSATLVGQAEGEVTQVSEISPNALMDALKSHSGPIYTKSKLPPFPGKPYAWKVSQEADPVDPSTYWPMKNYA